MNVGRAPLVCSDDALIEIIQHTPRKKSDFYSISGIGATFIEKYSDYFLEVINKHLKQEETPCKPISNKLGHTMRELEKKLVNINRRNRLLYMPKITKNFAYDMYDSKETYYHSLLFGNRQVKICDIKQHSNIKGQSGEEKYKRISALLREVEKDFRDKGQFDLYIGYPFVRGRLASENFDIRAPLVLFPIEYVKEANHIKLKIDASKDIVYNNNLLLAHYKFSGLNKPLPDCTIEDISEKSFIKNTLNFFKREGIEIAQNDERLYSFENYKAGEFPKYINGEFIIENTMVLGKFPTYASSIQKDFNEIINSGNINSLLETMLSGMSNAEDFYTDSYSGDLEVNDSVRPLTISEHELAYVGDLNSSQENVITAIKKQDALVVQGPPGTGKSQTITSLIADYVTNKKSVLMVAEKRTALDVVYSRLGDLNKYALLIHNLNDKKDFYNQMSRIVDLRHRDYFDSTQIRDISDRIDGQVKLLEAIATNIYSPNDFGIELYKLYLLCDRINLDNEEDAEKFRQMQKATSEHLLKLKYLPLSELHKMFESSLLVENIDNYNQALQAGAWINNVKEDLTEFEVLNLKELATEVEKSILLWKSQNFIKKIFSKKEVLNQIRDLTERYFNISNRKYSKILLGMEFCSDTLRWYERFVKAKPVYKSLNESAKHYYKSVKQLSKALSITFHNGNDELFNYILCSYIFQFEAKNRGIISSLDNFKDIILILSKNIEIKKKFTKRYLECLLYNSLSDNIINVKRQGDLRRKIESKRKWSINKFLNTFSFEMFKGIKIWLMTPDAASEVLPLEPGLFDLVIFDEASQMFVEKGIPAIHRAKKVVIAGDSKQLRPSNLGSGRVELEENCSEDEEVNAALEEESLLDVARFKYTPPVTLNYHYRSQYEELIAFSNYAFYKAGLYISPNVKFNEKSPIEVVKIDNGVWANRCNRHEAIKVVELLKKFLFERQNNETIGIITFNSSQRDLIEEIIDEECARNQEFNAIIKSEIKRKRDGEDIGLFVNNIERVQGDERDVIMFSIGYAKDATGRLAAKFGWLNQKGGENRLNVAISRAKSKIVIVTSFEPSELFVENAKNNGPKFLKKYLEYCFAVSRKDAKLAKQILLSLNDTNNRQTNAQFDSEFENEVYDELINKGYQVDTQVGIGGYSIDLAIKKEEQYILGIECDGKLYHSSKSARERDYHRQKYLESRGWIIHRIWSTKWWKNPKHEIDKIVNLVESYNR